MKHRNIPQISTDYLTPFFCLAVAFFSLPFFGFAQVSTHNYATGNVSGRSHVGGLIGRNSEKDGAVNNSYARGSATGETQIGGFAGSNSGTIEKAYATGKVTGNSNAGGLVGSSAGTVTASYWDMQTSTQSGSSGGTGRNTDPMTWPYATDTYSGWDFTATWKADLSPFQNGGYPLLATSALFQVAVQVYPPGAGKVSGEGYYPSGQQIQLGLTADSRYVFKGWMRNTELLGTGLQYSLKVSGNTSLIARLESKTTSAGTDIRMNPPAFRLYPNPVKDILRMDFSAFGKEVTGVSVVNMTGQELRVFTPSGKGNTQAEVDVSAFLPGVYVLRAFYSGGYSVAKFIKY